MAEGVVISKSAQKNRLCESMPWVPLTWVLARKFESKLCRVPLLMQRVEPDPLVQAPVTPSDGQLNWSICQLKGLFDTLLGPLVERQNMGSVTAFAAFRSIPHMPKCPKAVKSCTFVKEGEPPPDQATSAPGRQYRS